MSSDIMIQSEAIFRQNDIQDDERWRKMTKNDAVRYKLTMASIGTFTLYRVI